MTIYSCYSCYFDETSNVYVLVVLLTAGSFDASVGGMYGLAPGLASSVRPTREFGARVVEADEGVSIRGDAETVWVCPEAVCFGSWEFHIQP